MEISFFFTAYILTTYLKKAIRKLVFFGTKTHIRPIMGGGEKSNRSNDIWMKLSFSANLPARTFRKGWRKKWMKKIVESK